MITDQPSIFLEMRAKLWKNAPSCEFIIIIIIHEFHLDTSLETKLQGRVENQ